MFFPHFPNAFPGTPDPRWSNEICDAWSLLGRDLPGALIAFQRLSGMQGAAKGETFRDCIAIEVGLAEYERRRFASPDSFDRVAIALERARASEDSDLLVGCLFAAALCAWDIGYTDRLQEVLRELTVQQLDKEAQIALKLCFSRLARLRGNPRDALPHASEAYERIKASSSSELVQVSRSLELDATRELGAVLLLTNSPSDADKMFRVTLNAHREDGDIYRCALSEILLSRAATSLGNGEALSWLDAVVMDGKSIRSEVLVASTNLLLAQHFQRGATPDSVEWQRAHEAATTAYEALHDPFSRIELSLVLANLYAVALDLGTATKYADEAFECSKLIKNKIGIGGYHKVRSRILMAQSSTERGVRRKRLAIEAKVESLKAKKVFTRIGMPHTAALTATDREVARALQTGDLPDLQRTLALLGESKGDSRDLARRLVLVARSQLAAGNPTEALRALASAAPGIEMSTDRHLRIGVDLVRAEALVASSPDEATKALISAVNGLSLLDRSLAGSASRARLNDASDELTLKALELAVALNAGEMGFWVLEIRRTGRLSGMLDQTVAKSPTEIARLVKKLEVVSQRNQRPVDLRDELSVLTSRAFADTYDPEPCDIDALLASVDDSSHILILEDRDDSVIVGWRCASTGAMTLEEVTVDDRMTRLLDLLGTDDLERDDQRAALDTSDLSLFSSLIPGALRDILASSSDTASILIIPSGRTWAIPWYGVDVDSESNASFLLFERSEIRLFPSLRMHRNVVARKPAPTTGCALVWGDRTDTLGTFPELEALLSGQFKVDRPTSTDEFRSALLQSESVYDVAAISAHGNSSLGLSQAVSLNDSTAIDASDLLGSRLSPILLLGACHSIFSTGYANNEPMGIATLAICAGASIVLGCTTKLAVLSPELDILGPTYARIANGGIVSVSLRQSLLEIGAAKLQRLPALAWSPLIAIEPTPKSVSLLAHEIEESPPI